MSCECGKEPFILLKGYASRWDSVDWMSILFSSDTKVDFTGFSAKFKIGQYIFENNDLTQPWIINLTDEQTATLPLGMNTGSLIVYDTEGAGKPFTTSIPILVKDWVDGDVEIDTYKATILATLDNQNEFIVNVETAKVSLEWVEGKISEHNNSNLSHPYILGLIDDEKQARINVDNQLSDRINSISGDLSNYRTAAQQDIIDNNQNEAIASKQNQLSQSQLQAVNSGITSQKVSSYDNHIANTTIHVTSQEKQTWDNKQNEIQDLDTIRSNALAGKNASDTISGYGNIVTRNVNEFATSAQGAKADSALQPSDVINNTSSNDTDKPLSANMGKSLQDQVDNLKARGRFLALWNCATGLAESNPPSGTYTYQSGDYFIVGVVAQSGGTNYKPDGSTYTTGVASTVIETQPVDTDDVYYYDGHVWRLQVNTQKEIGFVNIAGDPYDNTTLAAALNEKQDEIDDLDEIRSGASAGSTALQPSALNGYATETWVGQQGFLTSTALSGYATQQWVLNQGYVTSSSLSGYVPYSGATGTVDLNAQDLMNVDNLAVGTATVDSNEKILSVGQNRFVSNNNNGLFISSTTSQARKGMYGVPMALEIQFNSNNQAYSYPLGFHDMNSNNNGGQFLFTSFSSNIAAATAGDVMVENDKGGLIFNTGNSKSGSKMRFVVGNWSATPQLTLTANGVGIKNLNPNSNYALDVSGTINASTDVKVNGVSVALPSQSGNSGKFLTTDGSSTSWAALSTDANVQYVAGGGSETNVDLSTLYLDSMGATYGFAYDSNSGTIKNTNQDADETFSYAKIDLYLDVAGDVTISVAQDSEQGYDYGEVSEIDEYLTRDSNPDSYNVAWEGYNYGTTTDTITFYNVSAGSHFFTVKYLKDSSAYSGTDTFEITGITLPGTGGGSLIDTNTQQEIPLSEINDMPQVLQDIRDLIPEPVDPSDFVTLSTSQKIQAAKAIFGADVAFGSDTTQKNLLAVVSNSNSTGGTWIGRMCVGAKNKTFIMGTYGSICALGAHSWTNAQQGTGAAWEPVYINPDGDKAVYIGGSPINGRQALMVLQNVNANTTGTVKINRSTNLSNNFKDVACWSDDVKKFDFTQISGYSAGSNQTLTHDSSGNLKWVNS